MISWILIVSSHKSWSTCGLSNKFSALSPNLSSHHTLRTRPKALDVSSQVELLAGQSSKSFMSHRVWGKNTSRCQLLAMTLNDLQSLREEFHNASCLAGNVGCRCLSHLCTYTCTYSLMKYMYNQTFYSYLNRHTRPIIT